MRILCTNDDGYTALGIVVLADAVRALGHDVVVAAPCSNMSGQGAAIGALSLDARVAVERGTTPSGIPTFGVDGPPALAVLAAHLDTFGPRPDLVLSGVNAGLNTGGSILHSGTVGAALTAAQLGTRALAVSVDQGAPWRFDTAAAVAVAWIDWLLGCEPGFVINLNVPNRGAAELLGTRWATLDPQGAVQIAAAERDGPLQLELRGRDPRPAPPGSDTALVAGGYVAATRLRGASEQAGSPGPPTAPQPVEAAPEPVVVASAVEVPGGPRSEHREEIVVGRR